MQPIRQKFEHMLDQGRSCRIALVACVLALGNGLSGKILVPHGGIRDHGDIATPHSLAWHLAKCMEGDQLVLSSSKSYETTRPLHLPKGVTLTVASDVSASIKASDSADDPIYDAAVIKLESHSQLSGRVGDASALVIDANRIARLGIDADGTTGVILQNLTVRDTLNKYPAETRSLRKQHLISANLTSGIIIRRCSLSNAGFPALDFGHYESVARGISLNWSTDGVVEGCHIRGTLGASIAIADSLRISLLDNRLELSGRCSADYGKPYSEDSIIGYHSRLTVGQDKQIIIARNVITDWGNHGIHVSGFGFKVTGNTITDGVAGYAFYLGDWREPKECSGHSIITDNVFGPSNATDMTVRIGPHLKDTIVLERNTGQKDTTTVWEGACATAPSK